MPPHHLHEKQTSEFTSSILPSITPQPSIHQVCFSFCSFSSTASRSHALPSLSAVIIIAIHNQLVLASSRKQIMTKLLASSVFLVCVLTQQVASFGIGRTRQPAVATFNKALFSTPEDAESEEAAPKKLILDLNEVKEKMAKLKSKYPTAEADYLAAARKRAELKVESRNNESSDEDWQQMAAEKSQQMGGGTPAAQDDGWEASLKDEGNAADSQIFIPMEGGEDEEPKLLL